MRSGTRRRTCRQPRSRPPELGCVRRPRKCRHHPGSGRLHHRRRHTRPRPPPGRREAADLVATGVDRGARRCGRRRRSDADRAPHQRHVGEVRRRGGFEADAVSVRRRDDVVGPRRVDPPVGTAADDLHRGGCREVPSPAHRPARRVGDGRDADGHRVLLHLDAGRRPGVPLVRRPRGLRRPWPQPTAAEPRPGRLPPATVVPGLRRVHGAVRVRHCRPRHRSRR